MKHELSGKQGAVKLLLEEIKDLYRFFKKTPVEKKTIVFYSEHEGYYSYFEGVIKQLTEIHNYDICYITSSAADPIFQSSNSRINAFYSKNLLPLFMIFVNCKVLVMTLTELNQAHIRRSTNPVHYVYMFHSLVSTHMMYRKGSFDHYDTILCVGPHHIEEIRRNEELYHLPSKELIEAGYYRLERIIDNYKKYVATVKASADKGVILIAPSWGDHNILESCGEQLVDILLNAGYEVIVRPHPEALKHSPGWMKIYATKFRDNPKFFFETSVATDDSLLRADVLISDWSGVILEYTFGTERPVLFMDVPRKIKNEQFEELGITPLEVSIRSEVGIILSLEEIDTIDKVIAKLIADKEIYKNKIRELKTSKVFHLGRSSEIGAQYIINQIN